MLSRAVLEQEWVTVGAKGGIAVWASGMWKDDVGQGLGKGERGDLYQPAIIESVSSYVWVETLANV